MGRNDRRCDACGWRVPPHAPDCAIVAAERVKAAAAKAQRRPRRKPGQ